MKWLLSPVSHGWARHPELNCYRKQAQLMIKLLEERLEDKYGYCDSEVGREIQIILKEMKLECE